MYVLDYTDKNIVILIIWTVRASLLDRKFHVLHRKSKKSKLHRLFKIFIFRCVLVNIDNESHFETFFFQIPWLWAVSLWIGNFQFFLKNKKSEKWDNIREIIIYECTSANMIDEINFGTSVSKSNWSVLCWSVESGSEISCFAYKIGEKIKLP